MNAGQPGKGSPREGGIESAPSNSAESVEAARMPKGFWKKLDYFLHHPEAVTESVRRDTDLVPLCRTLFLISIIMAAVYGAVMGGTNLFQGSEMLIQHKLLMVVISAIKVPILFILTLAIVIPPIYVSNAFVGARLSFRQMLTVLLTATTITVTTLASMATVAFFFALTSRSYDFIKLLHVLIYVYAGLAGLAYFSKTISGLSVAFRRRTPAKVLLVWLLIYAFVGTQLAWVLRPFVGSPDLDFKLFRPRYGNFYESVIQSATHLVQAEEVQEEKQPDATGSAR
jgi:hypothetical protein